MSIIDQMAKLLNKIIVSLTAFFICFCWVFALTKQNLIACLIGLCLGVGCFLLMILYDKNVSPKPTKSQQAQKNKADQLSLAFLDENCVKQLLNFKNFSLEDNGTLFATKNDVTYFVAIHFGFSPFDCQDLANAFKKAKPVDNILVFCNQVDKEVCDLAKQVGINLVVYQQKQVVEMFAECNVEMPKIAKKPKPKILYFMFNKNRFRQWFGSAVFLTFVSWFSPFGLWLLVWATLTFSISLYCLFNKQFNVVEKSLL